MSEIDLKALAAEFPRASVSWRAQSMTAAGDKAMALAYIDARDVMDRLDEVCGAENWQDRYEFHGPRTVCYLSLRINGEWVTKADGAGDSDVEAEKGAISDALKRAAVKWGIGRYLYALPAPWVPCEHYEKGGKKYWKRWTVDPWSQVRTPAKPEPRVAANSSSLTEGEGLAASQGKTLTRLTEEEAKVLYAQIQSELEEASKIGIDTLTKVWKARYAEVKTLPEKWELDITDLKDNLKALIAAANP
jgi:hypothetical protein